MVPKFNNKKKAQHNTKFSNLNNKANSAGLQYK